MPRASASCHSLVPQPPDRPTDALLSSSRTENWTRTEGKGKTTLPLTRVIGKRKNIFKEKRKNEKIEKNSWWRKNYQNINFRSKLEQFELARKIVCSAPFTETHNPQPTWLKASLVQSITPARSCELAPLHPAKDLTNQPGHNSPASHSPPPIPTWKGTHLDR